MRLVMYTQDLERTWDDVAQVFVAYADGKRVRSGWVLFVNSPGCPVLPLRALRTHGKSTEGAIAQRKRSS